jgi:hypothetical protein
MNNSRSPVETPAEKAARIARGYTIGQVLMAARPVRNPSAPWQIVGTVPVNATPWKGELE